MALTLEDRPIVAMMATQIYVGRIQAGQKEPDRVTVAAEAINLLDCIDRHLPTLLRKRAMDRNPRPKSPELEGKNLT